jgi:hypothetical protein
MEAPPLEALIANLDLAPVRYLLAINERWTLERILIAELEYRCFLQLIRAMPQSPAVPSPDADIYWHQHILCTPLYVAHCESLFGKYLHHYPFSGHFGTRDAARQHKRFQKSQVAIAEMVQRVHRTQSM